MICKSGQYLFIFLNQGNSELAAYKGGLGHPKEFFTLFRETLFARARYVYQYTIKIIFFFKSLGFSEGECNYKTELIIKFLRRARSHRLFSKEEVQCFGFRSRITVIGTWRKCQSSSVVPFPWCLSLPVSFSLTVA